VQGVLFVRDMMETQEIMDTVDIVDAMEGATIYGISLKREDN
jgi:hypothetical protein